MQKGDWASPSTFIKHYSLPIKHFSATLASIEQQGVSNDQSVTGIGSPPAGWEQENSSKRVDDALANHSMIQVNKLIRKDASYKKTTVNTVPTFHKVRRSERKAIAILEKNLRSTVIPSQRIQPAV